MCVTKERLAARENYKNHLNIRKFAFPTTTVRSVKTMVISGDVSFRLLSPFLANRQDSDWQLPDYHAMAAKTASQQVGRQKVSAEDERKKERGKMERENKLDWITMVRPPHSKLFSLGTQRHIRARI